MARVDRSAVSAILRAGDEPTEATDLDPCITVANLLVTAKLSAVDAELQTEAERWWAAYIWKDGMDDSGKIASRRSFDVAETYRAYSGGASDLQSNHYGRILSNLVGEHIVGIGQPVARFVALA